MTQKIFLLFFSFAIIYIFLGIFIYLKDRFSQINKSFLYLCINTSCWALGYAFMTTSTDIYIANFWRLISALGWCFWFSTWVIFSISLRYKNKIIINGILEILLIALPIIFYINTLKYDPSEVMVNINGMWVEFYPIDFMQIMFIIYHVVFIGLGIALIYNWGKVSNLNREKKQSKIIAITSSISFISTFLIDRLLPLAGINTFPITIMSISFVILSIVYTISKYKMMNITTVYVSDYIFKSVNDPIFFIGENFLIKKANRVALKTIGYSFKDIENKSLDEFIKIYNFSIDALMQIGKANNLESNLLKSDGDSIECTLSASVIYDEFNDMLGIVVILHDISEIKKSEKLLQNYNIELEKKIFERTIKLEEANETLKKEIAERISAEKKILHMGYYDELTGLPNRRCFNEYINKYIQEIDDNMYFAVMFLDLDNFKFVNDTFGHNSGDMLLKYFSGHISKVIREEDMLARIGGDEFLILLSNLSKENAIEIIETTSDKIINIFKEPFLIENKENYVTTSIGVACYPQDGNDSETIIKNADIAMYEAKRLGKNNVKICSDELKNKIIEKAKIRNGLYRALELGEMFLYYQPQVNIRSNKIIGFEALLRWKYRHEKFISPVEFIPIAEEVGLIIPIGYWVIRTACSSLKKYHDLGFHYTMAINLSANQLEEKDFSDKVSKIIDEIKVNPNYLEFEITERITFNTSDTLIDNLKKLKILGIKISLDDFGIEYSSYIKIKTLPIDKIKIAKEFIQEINGSEKDNEIVNSIIQLSHDLKLDIIAEGVEEKEQLDFLVSKNCNEVQGFFYYKPMPASEIDDIISEIA